MCLGLPQPGVLANGVACSQGRNHSSKMSRLAVLLSLAAISGLLTLLAAFWLGRRQKSTLVEPSPSAVLLRKLGRWHYRRHQESQALLAYHWARQAQIKANAVHSILTPLLLYDIGAAMDATASQFALTQKLLVYEELASILELFSWEEHLGELTDQTEAIRDVGMAALSIKEIELEISSWQVSLRLCLATNCGETIRHAEILLRVGVSVSKRPGQDLDKVLEAYEEAERIFEQLDQRRHQLYAILVHNFGATYGQRGNRRGEKDYFEKALQIYRNATANYTETYTSLLYEVAMAREEMGDADGGLEAFNEAERAFLHNPSIGERLRTTHVTSIGDMRRTVGNLAGSLHAYEVAEKVHKRMGTLDSSDGVSLQKSLKEVKALIASLPEKKRWVTLRDLETHRRPMQPASRRDFEHFSCSESSIRNRGLPSASPSSGPSSCLRLSRSTWTTFSCTCTVHQWIRCGPMRTWLCLFLVPCLQPDGLGASGIYIRLGGTLPAIPSAAERASLQGLQLLATKLQQMMEVTASVRFPRDEAAEIYSRMIESKEVDFLIGLQSSDMQEVAAAAANSRSILTLLTRGIGGMSSETTQSQHGPWTFTPDVQVKDIMAGSIDTWLT
eukprot:s2156_g12.t1